MAANSQFSMAVHVLTMLARAGDDNVKSDYIAGSVNTNPGAGVPSGQRAEREARDVTPQRGVRRDALLVQRTEGRASACGPAPSQSNRCVD